jgi:hypothetical protein
MTMTNSKLDLAVAEMLALLEYIGTVRESATADNDRNVARDELAALAAESIEEFGLLRTDLSRMLDRSPDWLGQFLNARGYKNDSFRTNGAKGLATHCMRGHDLTLPGARVGKRGQCAVCRRMRKRVAGGKSAAEASRDLGPGVSLQLSRLIAPQIPPAMSDEALYAEVLRAIADGAHTPAKLAASALEAAARR